jgi:DNA methyltransferase 1-associated protein 1
MAANASDVRSILSIQTSSPAGPSTQTPTIKKSTAALSKKPEGISRELYSLIGNATPSLTEQFTKPRLKKKPDFGKGKTRWGVSSMKHLRCD